MVWTRSYTDGSSLSSTTNLLTRGSWKRAIFRLLDTSATDDGLLEHDLESLPQEGLLLGLQEGLDSAQEWLLQNGLSGWWVTRSSELSWSGTDASTGGRYTSLPSNFRRVAGNETISPFVKANGDRWGQMVEWEQRYAKGQGAYFRDGQLWLLRNANPPSPLYLEYVRRLTIPGSDTEAFSEFPRPALPLIPAFAAVHLMDEDWVPGGPEMEAKVERRLLRLKQRTMHTLRLTQGPRTVRQRPVTGNRYWL